MEEASAKGKQMSDMVTLIRAVSVTHENNSPVSPTQ